MFGLRVCAQCVHQKEALLYQSCKITIFIIKYYFSNRYFDMYFGGGGSTWRQANPRKNPFLLELRQDFIVSEQKHFLAFYLDLQPAVFREQYLISDIHRDW